MRGCARQHPERGQLPRWATPTCPSFQQVAGPGLPRLCHLDALPARPAKAQARSVTDPAAAALSWRTGDCRPPLLAFLAPSTHTEPSSPRLPT